MKLLTDIDMLLLLISCQNPGHKFGSDTMHAQFSSRDLLACPVTNSDLISKVLNGLTSVVTNELLKFGCSVGHCGVDGPTSMLLIFNGYPNIPEPTHVQFMQTSLNAYPTIDRVSIAQNLMLFVGSIAKSHQARYVTPNKRM
jgi:hypothetical protein